MNKLKPTPQGVCTPVERLMKMNEEKLTVSDLADKVLFRSHRAVLKRIRQGHIPAVRDERGWWIIDRHRLIESLNEE